MPDRRPPRVSPKGLVPLVGGWSGDGTDSLGFYNPRYGTFHLYGLGRSGRRSATLRFGPPHMIPLTGEWPGA
ncbi:MAG TPA: hypothetical protein VNF47_17915 [Streptosporangiaceae bacterium]|nr:hypothetical protein [Streptosporangiaceae bacterium]